MATIVNIVLIIVYTHVAMPKLDAVLYVKQKAFEPLSHDVAAHHDVSTGEGADAAQLYEDQHGGGPRLIRSDGTVELFNDHNTRQNLIAGGDGYRESEGDGEQGTTSKRTRSLPFEQLVSHIIEHDREHTETLGSPLSRYSRSRFRQQRIQIQKEAVSLGNNSQTSATGDGDNGGDVIIHKEAERIAWLAAQFSPVAYVELSPEAVAEEVARDVQAVARNRAMGLVPPATTYAPPSEGSGASIAKRPQLPKTTGPPRRTHHRKVRRGPPRVLVPPPLLLAFTLNGTVPLIYEYRNDDNVIVRKKEEQRAAEGLSGREEGGGKRRGKLQSPPSAVQKNIDEKVPDAKTDINDTSTVAATSPTLQTDSDTTTGPSPSSEAQPAEITKPVSTKRVLRDSDEEGVVYFEVEGRDFVTGRRYYGVEQLQKALNDQIYLLHTGWLPVALTGARGGALDGSNGGTYKKVSSGQDARGGGGRHVSSSADLSTLTDKQLRYFTQILFLEALVKVQMYTEGEEVAVFGSLETPALEVALLTVGRAAKVTSVDYRPILCEDQRVEGFQLREFWELHERKWGKKPLTTTPTPLPAEKSGDAASGSNKQSLNGGDPANVSNTSSASSAVSHHHSETILEQVDHFTFRLKSKTKRPPASAAAARSLSNATAFGEGGAPFVTTFQPKSYPPEKFSVIVAFGSVQHDGLGRYGDPLDPFGDIHAVSEMWGLLPFGGLLILSVPVGNDCLVFNMFRVYGRRRLPLLLFGWDVVEVYGLDDRYSTELYYADQSTILGTPKTASQVEEEKAASGSILSALQSALGWFTTDDPRSRERQMAKEAMSVSPLLQNGPESSAALTRRRRRVSRFTDSQCRGDLRYSPIFVLKKISTREAMARKWEILSKVPGLMDGGFPLHHRPR